MINGLSVVIHDVIHVDNEMGHVLIADWSIAPFRCGHHDVIYGKIKGQHTNQLSGRWPAQYANFLA